MLATAQEKYEELLVRLKIRYARDNQALDLIDLIEHVRDEIRASIITNDSKNK